MASKTCPKIIEHFGAAEIWALKLGPEWVGTDAKEDIPLSANVRRYYVGSSTHGGGSGGFNASLAEYHQKAKAVSCPGNNWGNAVLPANPLSHDEPWRAITVHFRNWVMNNTAPPPSRYPTLREGQLVAPNKTAMGFPTIPGLRATAPEPDLINPLLDYDWGPQFDPNDASGIPTYAPPKIKQTLNMLVPKVNADGNEIGGIPVVLLEAPLGTYTGWNIYRAPHPADFSKFSPPPAPVQRLGLEPGRYLSLLEAPLGTNTGWNITASGFHAGQLCNYAGGMVPFARTKAEREAGNDPRLSLEERYGSHAGFVDAVRKAADKVKASGFLLDKDAAALIKAAEASNVLR